MVRSPHEFYVWNTLAFVTVPGAGPQLEVVDLLSRTQVAAWDPGLGSTGDDILHSVSISPDGHTAYLSHQTGGLALADVTDPYIRRSSRQRRSTGRHRAWGRTAR